MKGSIIPILELGVALCAEGAVAVANPDGILEVADAAAMQAAVESSGADGLTLGNGMLKWTGTGETTWNGTFTTAPVSNLEVTVNVVDPDATLKIAGAASADSAYGVFLKSGPGALEFNGGGTIGTAAGNYPWAYGWWVTYAGATSAAFQPGITQWSETTGIATGGGYSIMTVADGTLRFNAPGQTFNIPIQPWIGSRLQNSPRMEVTNGTTVVSGGGVFCIARGTGTTANDAAPSVAVTDGGSLSVTQLSMGYANGQADFYPRSRVELDGGTLNVTGGPIEQPQNDTGRAVLTAANGALLYSGYRAYTDYGWLMRGAAEALLSSSSTAAVRQIANNPNTKISVEGGSVLKFDRTVPKWYNQAGIAEANPARVYFDDSTLTRYSDAIGEWFGNRGAGYTNFVVGVNGLTLEADGPVWFGATPRADEGGSRGTIVKNGSGPLFMRPSTNLPVSVAGGTLGLTMHNPLRTNDTAMAVTLAPGADLAVGGEGALGGSSIAVPSGSSVTFMGGAAPDNLEWVCNNFARRFFDGTIQLTLGDTDSWGSAWHSNLVSVAGSFTVTFDSFTRCGANVNAVEPYYGWMLVLQNKDLKRIGGGGNKYGYGGGSAGTAFTDAGVASYAVGLNVLRCKFVTGRNGSTPADGEAFDSAITKMDLAASVERPCRNTFSYDADAHTATLSIFIPSLKRTVTHTETVDLAALLGPQAYVGFTAATHSARNSEHCIRNFRLAYAASRPGTLHTGGALDVAATGSLDAVLNGNDAIGVFAADVLKGNGAVTLNLADGGAYPEEPVEIPEMPAVLSSTDESLWEFAGAGHMADNGPACSTGPRSNGGFISKIAVPVTGSWKLSYDWKSGLGSGESPADAAWFSIDNRAEPLNFWNSDGVSLDMAIYNGFSVRLTVKGTAVPLGDGDTVRANLYTDANGERWFDARYKGDIHVEFEHDADAKTLAVTLSQQDGAVSKTFTVENFDASSVFGSAGTAKVRAYQTTGGAYAEAIYANLAFKGDVLDAEIAAAKEAVAAAKAQLALRTARGALAFGRTEGVTSVETSGTGHLAFLEPGAWTVPVTVRGAGLRFAKPAAEDVAVGAGGGWVFNNPTGGYSPDGGVKIGSNVANNRDNAHYRHRVYVAGDWRASWTLKNVNSKSADGISFFLHNDPRGENAVGGGNGCGGFANCFAIGWYTYANANPENKWGLCKKQGGVYWQESVAPVVIRSGDPIDVTLEHDASAKTVTMTMTQGANEYKTVIEDVDMSDCVGGDFAWMGFGSAGGGLHTYPVFDNFKFEHTDGADPLSRTAYLPSATIAADADVVLDSGMAGRVFRVAETLSVADGKTLRAFASGEAATLSAGTLSLGEGAALAGQGGATFAPDALAGDLSTLSVDNATLEIPAADSAAGKFADTTLSLSNGAKVKLSATFAPAEIVIDGERLPQGVYRASNCSWIVGPGMATTVRATVFMLR